MVFDSVLNDVRTALRQLRARPTFTALAVATLAIGIGANIAIFAIVNSVLLQPLPYGQSDRLAIVWSGYKAAGQPRVPSSGPELVELRARSRSFEQIGAIWATSGAFTGEGEPEQVRIGQVTSNFFSTLGVNPALGRSFLKEEEGNGAPPVVMLSHGLFMRRFAGDPAIVNRIVHLGGRPFTVIGVMPEQFQTVFPADASVPEDIQAWVPFPNTLSELPRDLGFLRIVGRLKPGVTASQAQAEVNSIAAQLRSQFREYTEQGLEIAVYDFQADVVREIRPALLALLGAVFVIVLLSCANVAHLLLTRNDERHLEITIRTALGGSQLRIFRQLLTESIALASVGGIAAFLVANLILGVYPKFRPQQLAAFSHISLDWRVTAFSIAITLFCGVVFGLAPAMATTRHDLSESLKSGARSVVRSHALRRKTLVVIEVAMGFILLVAAGLLSRTMLSVLRLNPGFDAAHVTTFQLSLPGNRYPSTEKQAQGVRELQARLAAIPGVTGAAATSHIPFGSIPANWYSGFWPEGATVQERNTSLADHRSITPGYFHALGVPLIAGRDFTNNDIEGHLYVTIVDEALAAKTWPGRDPIGQKLNVEVIDKDGNFVRNWAQVIGVVGHVKDHALLRENRSQLYLPLAQSMRFPVTFTVRGERSANDMLPDLRAAVSSVDKDLPLANLRPMSAYLESARSQAHFMALLSQSFAFIAIVLCCVGVFGVVSSSVVQQTREIGIRMALGADRDGMLRMVLRQGLSAVAVGLALGAALSVLLTPALSSFLFGVKPMDPLTIAVTAIGLLVFSFAACYLPARRASTVEPMQALRWE